MARKPNYRFERAERERLKAERRAKREERKATEQADTNLTAADTGTATKPQDS